MPSDVHILGQEKIAKKTDLSNTLMSGLQNNDRVLLLLLFCVKLTSWNCLASGYDYIKINKSRAIRGDVVHPLH